MVAASVTAALPSLGCDWLGFCSGTGLAPVPHLCDFRRLRLHLRPSAACKREDLFLRILSPVDSASLLPSNKKTKFNLTRKHVCQAFPPTDNQLGSLCCAQINISPCSSTRPIASVWQGDLASPLFVCPIPDLSCHSCRLVGIWREDGVGRSLVADRHFSDIGLWHTEQFGGSFPASLPALGSYRDVATAAPCGPEDNPVATFCGLSPQRKLMNCCSLTWAGRGTLCVLTCALRHPSLMPVMSQHWHGEECCFLSPGSLNTETIWRLLGAGDFLKDGRMATERQILLGFLFTNLL